MAIYLSAGVSAESDWWRGVTCTVTTYYYQGTRFDSRYAPPAATSGNYADSGSGFRQNGTEIRTLIGDASVGGGSVGVVTVGGVGTYIP